MRDEIVAALTDAGITQPFPVQSLTLPITLGSSDVIGQARTGTGKTLAFAIPVLERVSATKPPDGRPRALVVVPTRELCIQVTNDVETAGRRLGVRVLAVYGGRAYEPQVDALRAGVDVVVGTPGRLLDLARQRRLDLSAVAVMVLDEADEMLDLGFFPDVEAIFELVPRQRQTMLFSATMPGPVVALARRFLHRPLHVRAEQPDETRTVPTTRQHVFRAHALDKAEMLARILQAEGRGRTMVFVRTKRGADRVASELVERGFAAAAVHGDLPQQARERALQAFRAGTTDVLVATDVAARGIDVAGVTHVVNYQCPEDEKVYLHRIGRTGRAGESGTAVTFVDWDDLARWRMINDALGLPFPEPPETYSTSPELREALDIPASAKGRLSRAPRQRSDAPTAKAGTGAAGAAGAAGAKAVPSKPSDAGASRGQRRRRRTRRGRPSTDGHAGTRQPGGPGASQPVAEAS